MSVPRRSVLIALGLTPAASVLSAGCNFADPPEDNSPVYDDNPPNWSQAGAGRADKAPRITEPEGFAPTSLFTEDLVVGDGDEVTDGAVVIVDYIGANFSTGQVFDSTYSRNPFAFTVGAGRVIKGWDRGIVGMKAGGRRQLLVPSDMAYGTEARGMIPGNEALIFIIDVRAVRQRPTPPATPNTTTLTVTDLIDGIGERTVLTGDRINVHYVGVHALTGEQFDSSWDRAEPFAVTIGAGQAIAGWDQGLIGMRLAGRRRLVIPPSLAYGTTGRAPEIQPYETLVFDVDLVGIDR